MTVLILVAQILVSYLLGSVSGSLLLGGLRGIDVRAEGSGNAGATNAFRTIGKGFGITVGVIDLAKGAVAAGVVAAVPSAVGATVTGYAHAGAMLCGLAAVLGHLYPVYYGFRGGKGAATFVGVLAVLWPLSLALIVAIWVIVLVATGYVGLATVLAAVAFVPTAWLAAPAADHAGFTVFALVSAALIVYTHRSNIRNLARGTEHRFEAVRLVHWLRRGTER